MPILEVKNLKKGFDGNAVLKGVSFSLEQGQVLAIIGSSGSGKTTLLRCLTGLEEADGGSILLPGGGSFGLVFQNFNLFPQYTALQNVMLAPSLKKEKSKEELKEEAMELLKIVGLEGVADELATSLPYGQQRRLEIVRALATHPMLRPV